MASYTGNLNLKKPALDDDALITDINNNMDILDAAVNGIQDGLAIVANGNTHVAITSGQFVYVRNHGTLTEGLYVASTNIAANATLSTSNLTADSAGGLNTVYASLNSKIKVFSNFTTPSTEDGELTGGTLESGYTVICARVYTSGQDRNINFGQNGTTVYAMGLIETYRNKPASLIAVKL